MPAIEGVDYLEGPSQGPSGLAQFLAGLLGGFQRKQQLDMQKQRLEMEKDVHKHNIKKIDADQKLADLQHAIQKFDFMSTQPGQVAPSDPTGGGEMDLAGAAGADGPGYAMNIPGPVSEQPHAPIDLPGVGAATPPTLRETLARQIAATQAKTAAERQGRQIFMGTPGTEAGLPGGMGDPALVPLLDKMAGEKTDLGPEAAAAVGLPPGKANKADVAVLTAAMKNRAAGKRAEAAGGRADRNARRADENAAFTKSDKLGDDYRAEMKPFTGLNQRLTRMGAAAKQGTGEGDLALMYDYIKMLDDMTGVREGEVKLSESAQSLRDKAEVALTKLKSGFSSGEKFSPDQRERFTRSAKALAQAMGSAKKEIDNRYRKRADRFGINFDDLQVGMTADDAGGGGSARAGAGAGVRSPQGHLRKNVIGPDGKPHVMDLIDGKWVVVQ